MTDFNRILDQQCNVYLQTNYQKKSVNACNSYRGFSEVTPQFGVSLPITRQRKVTETTKLTGLLSAPREHCTLLQMVKGQGHQTDKCCDRTYQPYFRDRKAYELQTWYLTVYGWSTKTRIGMRHDIQAESWLFKSPLAGGGAFYGGRTTGRTSC